MLLLGLLVAAGARAAPAPAVPDSAASVAGAAASVVQVALVPTRERVTVGDTLEVAIRVTEPGPGFNGYDAVIAFDPRALEHLPAMPPRSLEGDAMTGPCGNTFHRLRADGDSVVIAHVVLCAGVSLPGPATLHRLRFRALQPGRTSLRLRRTQFFDAGRYLPPAHVTEARVTVEGHPSSRTSP